MATESHERRRLKLHKGDAEAKGREMVVRIPTNIFLSGHWMNRLRD